MTSARPDAANQDNRAFLLLIAVLSLGILSGCGGAWQPDPRDLPSSPMRSGVEDSGLSGPEEEARTHL